jgi:hypothetical protein
VFKQYRIDAYLRPVPVVIPDELASVRSDLEAGVFDCLPRSEMTAVVKALARQELMLKADFNSLLNRMLKQYGICVSNIREDGEEGAVSPLLEPQEALSVAKDYQVGLLPAARSIFVPDLSQFNLPLPR